MYRLYGFEELSDLKRVYFSWHVCGKGRIKCKLMLADSQEAHFSAYLSTTHSAGELHFIEWGLNLRALKYLAQGYTVNKWQSKG